MDLKLSDKRALVTGSSDGIGEAIAHRLAAEGASVVINGTNETVLAEVEAAISATGPVPCGIGLARNVALQLPSACTTASTV